MNAPSTSCFCIVILNLSRTNFNFALLDKVRAAARASSALGLRVIHRTVRVARRAASRILGTKAAILRTGVRRVRQKELICPRLRNLLLSSVEHATTIISSARHARRILAIFRTGALTPVADRSIPCVSTTLTGSARIWLRRVSLFD